MKDLLKIIKERRSIRTFEKKEIPEDLVKKILEAGIWAPSAGNVQPWHFFIVRNKNLKERLTQAAFGQAFISQAPVNIVVCVDLKEALAAYGERGQTLYCLQDTAAAIQNMLLYAHSIGLGSCWVGSFDEIEASEALKLPSPLRPIAILPFGFPQKQPLARPRKEFKKVVSVID